ncbi:radical SAM protein [Candidatus Woesearchaeota archaeon]|nr:radical SAM protein [Candidatus Woesearchaeota archaeon]
MRWELFTKIIDEASKNKVYSIRLSWRGEPLIHPKVVDMIKYAKIKGIKEVSFLTNGLNMSEEMSRKLVDAGVDWITNSFDGTGKVYEAIRDPAKYEESLKRLKTIQRIKKEKGTKKPILKVQSVFSAIKDNPEEFYNALGPIVDEIAVNDTQDHSLKNKDQNPYYFCPVPWQRMVICWNGKVVQCINDFNDRNYVGDLNKQTIKEIWLGKELKEVRKLILKSERLKLKACTECFDGDRRKTIKVKISGREVVSGDLGFEFKNMKEIKKKGGHLDESNIRNEKLIKKIV